MLGQHSSDYVKLWPETHKSDPPPWNRLHNSQGPSRLCPPVCRPHMRPTLHLPPLIDLIIMVLPPNLLNSLACLDFYGKLGFGSRPALLVARPPRPVGPIFEEALFFLFPPILWEPYIVGAPLFPLQIWAGSGRPPQNP